MALAGNGVAIEARDASFRQLAMQLLFHFLRAESEKINVLALALGTLRGDLFGVVAIVAQHTAVAAVEGEGQRAVDTVDALATGAAGDRARESTTVEQKHGLLAV